MFKEVAGVRCYPGISREKSRSGPVGFSHRGPWCCPWVVLLPLAAAAGENSWSQARLALFALVLSRSSGMAFSLSPILYHEAFMCIRTTENCVKMWILIQ